MDNYIFDKTDKGREEIVTRKYRLASRLRSLLVMIDGKKSTPELLQKVAGLGLDAQSLVELIEGEFVESIAIVPGDEITLTAPAAAPVAAPAPLPAKASAPASPTGVAEGLDAAQQSAGGGVSGMHATKAIGAAQMLALQNFFNQTIKSTIGLRGFTLQLKVERASSLDDFQKLREPYLAAVRKAKGDEMALSLGDRLDQLLVDAEQSMR